MQSKKDSRPILIRLWIYQSERAPLLPIVVMAALTAGVIYNFASASLIQYFASVLITILYLFQIRTSDEKKDFEHDNEYYKNRPVQRGLVSLKELQRLGNFAIFTQLLIYISFLDWRILIIGLTSQFYAFLTRKEFYARKQLRKHLLTYNILHQIQLIILFFALINIMRPDKISYGLLLLFMLVNIATVELARKTMPADEDSAKDSYSWRFGYKGVAITQVIFAILSAGLSVYIISKNPTNSWFIALPVLALIPISNYAFHYSSEPNKKNQKGVENSAIIIFTACMFSLILGS
jgi:hypothetical protein